MNYLTYTYLLTPLHSGASAQAGNLMGIARESASELPYLPSSSLRGKIRSVLETMHPGEAGMFFGEKIKDGNQPTEGEVWFGDATLLLFPVASFSHQFLWITCPLWLSRWNRWLKNENLGKLIEGWQTLLEDPNNPKKAIASVSGNLIYLQGALLNTAEIEGIPSNAVCWECFKNVPDGSGILDLKRKLVVLSNQDCAGLVKTGLQREVRIALKDDEKVVFGGSFRSEEAIPSETVLFFPWGLKPGKDVKGSPRGVCCFLSRREGGSASFQAFPGCSRRLPVRVPGNEVITLIRRAICILLTVLLTCAICLVVNGAVTLVILLIAPLGLAAVIANTFLVTVASFFTATFADYVVRSLQPARPEGLNASGEERLGQSAIRTRNSNEIDRH